METRTLIAIIIGAVILVLMWRVSRGRGSWIRTLAIVGGAVLAVTLGWAILEPPTDSAGWIKIIVASALGVAALGGGLAEVHAALKRPDENTESTRAGTKVRQRAWGRDHQQTGVEGSPPPGTDVGQWAAGRGNVQRGIVSSGATAPPGSTDAPARAIDPATLRQILVERLSKDELTALTFDLGIDQDQLPSTTKLEFTVELLRRMGQLGRPLSEITDWLRAHRPDLNL